MTLGHDNLLDFTQDQIQQAHPEPMGVRTGTTSVQQGNLAGDRLLQLIAARCQAQMRGDERIARIGGKGFAIQLWLSSAACALKFAERIRTAISEAPFDLGLDQPIDVTASFGR